MQRRSWIRLSRPAAWLLALAWATSAVATSAVDTPPAPRSSALPPSHPSTPSAASPHAAGRALPHPTIKARSAAPPAIRPVDINSASAEELMTLPGIGPAEAARIMAARPYPSKAKLVAHKVLPADAYAVLRGRIVAVQKDAR